MDKLADLKDLLSHEVEDLYSAEQQIVDALPAMIAKAGHPKLKEALEQHLAVTRTHQKRLDNVLKLLQPDNEQQDDKKVPKGFLSRLFGGSGVHKCKGTEGLIKEGEQVMAEDMDPEVMDAAIIAAAQKIEHYEICGYGTAKAYARELKMDVVEALLGETLMEEYEADDLLTALAVGGGVNKKAEGRSASKRSVAAAGNRKVAKGSRQAPKKASSEKPVKKTAQKRAPDKKAVVNKSRQDKSTSKRAAAKKSTLSKAGSKKTVTRN